MELSFELASRFGDYGEATGTLFGPKSRQTRSSQERVYLNGALPTRVAPLSDGAEILGQS